MPHMYLMDPGPRMNREVRIDTTTWSNSGQQGQEGREPRHPYEQQLREGAGLLSYSSRSALLHNRNESVLSAKRLWFKRAGFSTSVITETLSVIGPPTLRHVGHTRKSYLWFMAIGSAELLERGVTDYVENIIAVFFFFCNLVKTKSQATPKV